MTIKTKNEFKDEQREKHKAYTSVGFKLKSTRKNKDTVVRKYEKSNKQKTCKQ